MSAKRDKILKLPTKIQVKHEKIIQLIEQYKVSGDTVNVKRWKAVLARLEADLAKAS